jgi:hypothetical protein
MVGHAGQYQESGRVLVEIYDLEIFILFNINGALTLNS